ncbi:stretch-activated Ca2+-permeable channel component-domain-containing protein [Mycena pura]|uniref:Stretch-activated Ca2+-permeable channel component-domain-containing protein n=1 Tax=Mycena pura TaxID=153505 RepID=A0AAD6VU11_9AGAR|nr:stretch-activated Ca2+-permeable channel component-domain-containing protein [Mycena pura]
MLPTTLLLLLHAALSAAQTRQTLSIDSVAPAQDPNPPFFTIPTAATPLAISIALCSGTVDTAVPRFFVSNSSADASNDPGPGGGGVFEIVLDNNVQGSWTGAFPSGGVLGVADAGQMPFEIGVSSGAPLHQPVATPPLLGDTTATQALLFSAPFAPQSPQDPTYPNYTLPDAEPAVPAAPANPVNNTVVVLPTTNSSSAGTPQTACMLLAQKPSGTVVNESLWLRDAAGWRTEWLLDGLSPNTNYTAYVVESSHKVSGPIYFTTKSPSFTCPLVSRLPYCPSIAYAMPLPSPPNSQPSYDGTTFPASIAAPLLSSLTNFTTTLTTFACGRDQYSPLVTCADCQRAYRTWLCTVSLARCADATTAPPGAAVLPSLPPNARNAAFPAGAAAAQLLPCLETCTATDRACPNFLGFRCPLPRFNAAQSYGVGFVDSGLDGVEGLGSTGTWADIYGNVWCNSGQ